MECTLCTVGHKCTALKLGGNAYGPLMHVATGPVALVEHSTHSRAYKDVDHVALVDTLVIAATTARQPAVVLQQQQAPPFIQQQAAAVVSPDQGWHSTCSL